MSHYTASLPSPPYTPINLLKAWLPVLLAAGGVVGLILIGQNIEQLTWVNFSEHPEVNQRFSYQFITFAMTLIYLLMVYLLRPAAFRYFARLGRVNAPANPVMWLGISNRDTWLNVGTNFGLIITLATSAYLYFALLQPAGILLVTLLSWLPIALALAAINAFVEEALTRFGIVVGLSGIVPPSIIFVISALIFGVPHYFGVPGGVIGAGMAAFLGWLLARSIIETRGVFWAWLLHFLQDVVIFATLLSVLTA